MPDDEKSNRVFSESEMMTLVADRVRQETASLTESLDVAQAGLTDVKTKLDVETAAKEAAEAARDEAIKALEDFKAEIEAEKAALARKGERLAEIQKAVPSLSDSYLDDTDRITRIVAMSDEMFQQYLGDLAKVVPGREVAAVIDNERKPPKAAESALSKLLAFDGKV